MSNRIAVFDDGKIQQISSPNILYEKPEMHLWHSSLEKIIKSEERLNRLMAICVLSQQIKVKILSL